MINQVVFGIDVKGESTDRRYEGVFEAKTKLSHRESLKEDEVRRAILGVNSTEASEYAKSVAAAIAYLSIRVQKAPNWFKDSNNGLDLEDGNVLIEVNNACVKAIDEARASFLEAAEKAKKDLEKHKTE
jgi:hypothetical protein